MEKLVPLSVAAVTVLVGCARTDMNRHPASIGDAGAGSSVTTGLADASTNSDAAVGAVDARAVGDFAAERTVTDAVGAADARSVADLPTERTVTDEGCIIAIRTDVCCGEPFVISRHEMDEDPCVQPYYGAGPPASECLARLSPPSCLYLNCYSPPLTRIAGRGQDGTCQFLDECESDADCVWALDVRVCCGCPAYYPRSLLATDRCLAAIEPGSIWDCPESVCAGVRCALPTCPPQTGKCTANPRQAAAGVKACTAS